MAGKPQEGSDRRFWDPTIQEKTKQSMDVRQVETKHLGRRLLAVLMVLLLILSMYLAYRAQIRFSGLNYVGQISEYAAQVTANNTGYLSRSTLDRAWAILRTTIRHPQSYDDFDLYASIAIAREDYVGATEYLQGCIDHSDPKGDTKALAMLYLRQASLYVLTEKYGEALSRLDRAIELNEKLAAAYFLRAEMYMVLGNEQAAVSDLNAYKNLEQADPEILSTFGPLYESTGDYDSAIECYTAGIKSVQAYKVSYYADRARCRLHMGDTAGARQDLEDYFTREGEDPNGEEAAMLAACRMNDADYSGALAMFHRAIADGYVTPYLLYSQSVLCAYMCGDYETVIRDGEKAIEGLEAAEKNSAELHSWVGLGWMAKGDYTRATEHFTEAAARDASLENVSYYLGISTLAQGDTEKAVICFTESVEKNESVSASLYNRAVCYLKQGLVQEAREDLNAVMERNDDPEVTAQAQELLQMF